MPALTCQTVCQTVWLIVCLFLLFLPLSRGPQESCVYEALVPPLEEEDFEKTLTPIVQEYFEHGDTNEVAVSGDDTHTHTPPTHTHTHMRPYRSDTQKHTVPTTS